MVQIIVKIKKFNFTLIPFIRGGGAAVNVWVRGSWSVAESVT